MPFGLHLGIREAIVDANMNWKMTEFIFEL